MITINNDIIDVTIEDVTADGSGVAKYDNYTIFVSGGVTGDKVNITVTKRNKSYGFGRINSIIEPSPFRTEPVCPAFHSCGGCDFMHIDYNYQIQIKENIIKGNLQRIGGVHPHEYDFDGVISAEDTLAYRNKAQLPLGRHKGKTVFGFYSKRSHSIVPIDKCLIQSEDINTAAEIFLRYANKYAISVYDEKSHKGILRHIYIRTGNKTGEMLFTVVTNSRKSLPHIDELINSLQSCSGLKGVIQNINTDKTNLILGKENRILWGENKICSMIGDLKFTLSSESFFQVNGTQTEKLYAKALEYASPEDNENVFDLYCGTGSISLFLAKKAKKVIGVEIVEKAIENAKENAENNGISNAEFYTGDCADVVRKLVDSGKTADVVVVDPPRKGCSEDMLRLINEISPKKLVYVSCNSATLARDVKILTGYGYRLKKVCGVDMFAHSGHIESVALIMRTDSSI